MTSQKQIDANRANAKNSTGPVTPEGKATVSQNAVTHGFAGKGISLADPEAKARLAEHKTAFANHYRPANPVEDALVFDIAVARTRIEQIEIKIAELELLGVNFDHHAMQLLHRYLRDAHRTWNRSRQAMDEIRRQQVRAELETVKTQATLLAAEAKASEPLKKELALLRQSLDRVPGRQNPAGPATPQRGGNEALTDAGSQQGVPDSGH